VTASERQAVLAFNGVYQVKSAVKATTGSYDESVGSVHLYTWQAVPDCGSQSCVVKVASSTGSHTVFTFSSGEFHGVGSGLATCYDSSGNASASEPTTLDDTLVPALGPSPDASLSGVVNLTTSSSGPCGGGTGTFNYTLKRTGNLPSETTDSAT
jgi:hypothetical protein